MQIGYTYFSIVIKKSYCTKFICFESLNLLNEAIYIGYVVENIVQNLSASNHFESFI